MKQINRIKLALDLFMLLVLALLYDTNVIHGLEFHEIAGLALGGVVLIHLALNATWIRKVTANLLSSKLSWKTRFGYLVDLLLLVSVTYILFSGIMISRILLPELGKEKNFFFTATHILSSYLTLVLIGIHVGLHWRMITSAVKKMLHLDPKKALWSRKIGMLVAAALITITAVSGWLTVQERMEWQQQAMKRPAFTQEEIQKFERYSEGEGIREHRADFQREPSNPITAASRSLLLIFLFAALTVKTEESIHKRIQKRILLTTQG